LETAPRERWCSAQEFGGVLGRVSPISRTRDVGTWRCDKDEDAAARRHLTVLDGANVDGRGTRI